MTDLVDVPVVDLEPLSASGPSELLRPAPIGVGTRTCESLGGYWCRVAALYEVRPYSFFARVVGPRLRDWIGTSHSGHRNGLLIGLGGLSEFNEVFASGFGRMVARDGLERLTLRPWRTVINGLGLLETFRRWCPECYIRQTVEGEPAYDPLAWSLRAVRVCVEHGGSLHSACPDCGHREPRSCATPGVCGKCGTNVSATARVNGNEETVRDYEYQLWAARQVGRLVAATAELAAPPPRQNVRAGLMECAARCTGGDVAAFLRSLSVPKATALTYESGARVPALDRILTFCWVARVDLAEFLLGRLSPESPSKAPLALPAAMEPTMRARTPPAEIERVRAVFEQELDNQNAEGLASFARQVGWSDSTLRRNFPAECDRLVALSRRAAPSSPARVQRLGGELHRALLECPVPSLTAFSRRARCTTATVRRYFPQEAARLAKRAPVRQRTLPFADSAELGRMLRAAVNETPRPCLRAVAQRTGVSPRTLRKHFPIEARILSAGARAGVRLGSDELDRIALALRAALEEEPSPTLQDFVRRVGRDNATVKAHFPEGTARLVAASKARVRVPPDELERIAVLVRKAVSDRPVPSITSLCRRVGRSAKVLRRHFPQEYAQIVSAPKVVSWLTPTELKRMRREMKRAARAYPRPSLATVAERLGHSRATLKKRFPAEADLLYGGGRNSFPRD